MTEAIWVFMQDHSIELITAAITFFWIYLEMKVSVWLWPVGIVLPLFWIYLSWKAHFLGNIAVNVYYLITSIIGWYMWIRKPRDSEQGKIKRIRPRLLLISTVCIIAAAVPIYGLMSNRWLWFAPETFHGSSLPWVDTLSTTVSFAGMIWLSLKVREHWVCWFVANILSAGVFFHAGDTVSGIVFIVNTIMSIVGYVQWIRIEHSEVKSMQDR